MGDLTKDFSVSEFACPCGKCEPQISAQLVNSLQHIRQDIQMPIRITSGFRCKEYNDKIGGEENSSHTQGEGADIAIPNNQFRHLFLNQALQWFGRIGIYTNHVHVDVSKTLPSPRLWIGVSK